MAAATPPVAIIMGSRSDWPTMKGAADALDALGVAYEAKVVSAHRTPQRLFDDRQRIADEQHVARTRGFGNGGGKAQREPLRGTIVA